MHSRTQELVRLAMLIERLLDADALLAEDAMALQQEIAGACQSLAAGDPEAARRHIAGLARCTEALVQTDMLDPPDGRAVLERARSLLTEGAG